MGRVFAPYGLQGWIHVTPFTEEPSALLDFRTWWIGGESMEVLEGKLQGKGLVAHLAGVADRDQAALLKGREISVPRSWLPAAGVADQISPVNLSLTRRRQPATRH